MLLHVTPWPAVGLTMMPPSGPAVAWWLGAPVGPDRDVKVTVCLSESSPMSYHTHVTIVRGRKDKRRVQSRANKVQGLTTKNIEGQAVVRNI
jgi:hypothetical protein